MKMPLRSFCTNRSGSILVLGPAVLVVSIGFTGLAVDGGNLYYTKLKLQKIADAAATGALFSLPYTANVTAAALNLIAKNTPASYGTVSQSSDVQIGTWDSVARTFTISTTNQNAVKVLTHRTSAAGNPVQTYFARLFSLRYVDVNASSVAVLYGASKCVYVLNKTISGAYSGGGSGAVTANCGIQVNSTANSGATMTGSSTTSAPVCVTGGYKGNGWSPAPKTGSTLCPQLSDPLASLAEPPVPTTCTTASGTSGPGCYTGSINLSGTVSLSPGLYYLKNANVTCNAGTTVTGTGVQIFVDATSTFNLNGSGDINLSSSPALQGIVIRASRANTGSAVTLGGNGALGLNGTIYAPASTVSLGGNSTYNGRMGFVIVGQLAFSGSSQFTLNGFGASAINSSSLISHSALTQ